VLYGGLCFNLISSVILGRDILDISMLIVEVTVLILAIWGIVIASVIAGMRKKMKKIECNSARIDYLYDERYREKLKEAGWVPAHSNDTLFNLYTDGFKFQVYEGEVWVQKIPKVKTTKKAKVEA